MSIDQDKAMMDPCCSFNLDQKLSNDKLNEHGELTDAELKIFLGRLVDESSDGNEIRSKLHTQILDSNDRRWLLMTRHLCMERLQRVDIPKKQRSSYKAAHYFSLIDQQLVKLAFKQLLEYCCAHFNDSFDALFQRIAAIVDFGRQLSSESLADKSLIDANCFFTVLQIQENTADNNIFRLSFRFAQFLAKISSIDGQAFEVDDPIKNDPVSRLFNDNESPNQQSNEDNDEDKPFELPADELADLCKRRQPKTVKSFMEMFRSKEDPADVLVAFECFVEFSHVNQSAIRAQSQQLIDLLMQVENRFSVADFMPKINSCIVHVLSADFTAVPAFCQRLIQVHGPLRRMQIVNCISALIDHLLGSRNQKPIDTQQKSRSSRKQPREIGKVIRKSATLTNKQSEKPASRPVVNVVDRVLRPFMSTVLSIDLVEKTEPITINGILTLLYNLQQQRLGGFRRLLDEYFLLLKQVRCVSDWNTQMRCVQCYAALAQMASADGENREEWSENFNGVDGWLFNVVQNAIAQSDRTKHAQLDDFQQQLSAFFGKLQI